MCIRINFRYVSGKRRGILSYFLEKYIIKQTTWRILGLLIFFYFNGDIVCRVISKTSHQSLKYQSKISTNFYGTFYFEDLMNSHRTFYFESLTNFHITFCFRNLMSIHKTFGFKSSTSFRETFCFKNSIKFLWTFCYKSSTNFHSTFSILFRSSFTELFVLKAKRTII